MKTVDNINIFLNFDCFMKVIFDYYSIRIPTFFRLISVSDHIIQLILCR